MRVEGRGFAVKELNFKLLKWGTVLATVYPFCGMSI